jgi:hypothetical protein
MAWTLPRSPTTKEKRILAEETHSSNTSYQKRHNSVAVRPGRMIVMVLIAAPFASLVAGDVGSGGLPAWMF